MQKIVKSTMSADHDIETGQIEGNNFDNLKNC